MPVSKLNYLSEEKLGLIPPKFYPHHELCFFIHDTALGLWSQFRAGSHPTVRIDFEDAETHEHFAEVADPITFLLNTGEEETAKYLSVEQAKMALFGDAFQHIYEGLVTLSKRKFVVSFSLLRKPFKENLILLMWCLYDEEDFWRTLRSDPASGFGHPGLTARKRKEIIQGAIDKIYLRDAFDPNFVDQYIFDRKCAAGLAQLFDKALHLVTHHGDMRTEDLNLNFIFKDPFDDDIFEETYIGLAQILLLYLFLLLELLPFEDEQKKKMAEWYSLTAFGSFSTLFIKGKNELLGSINRDFKPFMKCPYCHEGFTIWKKDAARFFINEEVKCSDCGMTHRFPLFWLISQSEIRVTMD